jgi:hypothetical protein
MATVLEEAALKLAAARSAAMAVALADAEQYRLDRSAWRFCEDQSAGRDVPPPRPASDLSRLGQERTMTNLTTMNGPPAAPSPHGISEPADLDLVRQALADASAWRAWKAEGAGCGDCDRLDPGRCTDHAADDELAAGYEDLLRRLVTEGPQR